VKQTGAGTWALLPSGARSTSGSVKSGPPIVDGLRTDTVAVTACGAWSTYKWGWQFFRHSGPQEAYVPFCGALGAAWDDSVVARWSADTLGMLWPEMEAGFVTSGGVGPPVTARPVVIIAGG
jgi:hypothetical protein